MYNRSETESLLKIAVGLGLYGADEAAKHPIECLSTDYNGIGPDCFPEALRAKIDKLAADLRPAALIHDFRWSHSHGTKGEFMASNLELDMNCAKIAATFSIFSWKRYWLRWEGTAFAKLCQRFGYMPYIIAFLKQQKGTKTNA